VFDSLNLDDRVVLWDTFGSNKIENVLARFRYQIKVLGVQYIVLDHISILVSDQENGDERKAIDEIMTKLRMFCQEMRVSMFIVSHLRRPEGKGHEDGAYTSLGQLRGSAAIAQLSDIVLGLERNAQAEDPMVRNTTNVRVLKNRFSGMTGPATALMYNKETGRLTEVFE
jgi:twinkle protein